jgi:hypothetical protein
MKACFFSSASFPVWSLCMKMSWKKPALGRYQLLSIPSGTGMNLFQKVLTRWFGYWKKPADRGNHHPPAYHPLDTVMTWVHSHLYEDINSNSQQYEGYSDSSTLDFLFLFSKMIALSALLSCTNMLRRNCFRCDIDFWFPFPKVKNLSTHVRKCHVVSS